MKETGVEKVPSVDGVPQAKASVVSAISIPIGCLLIAVPVFLPAYLTTQLGVDLTIVGAAWATVRLLDIGVDPLLGLLMDRTRSAAGRYRPWLLMGAPTLMLAIYALFEADRGIGAAYLVGWLLIMYLGLSILMIGQSAWAATLARGYDERSRLFGTIAVAQVAGSVLILLVPSLAPALGLTDAQAPRVMGWVALALTPLSIVFAVTLTPEVPPVASIERLRFVDCLKLLRRPTLLRLFLVQLGLTLGPGWMGGLYLFFFTAAKRFSAGQASVLLLAYVVAGVIGAPLAARAAVRYGKHRALIASTTIYSISLILVMMVPAERFELMLPLLAISGMMNVSFDLMIRSMLADASDEVLLESGRDMTALIYALNSLATKIAAALAIGLTYPLLRQIGFDPTKGSGNSTAALEGLELAYAVGPITFVLLGGIFVIGWPITAERHATIRRLLESQEDIRQSP